ncbi:MAG: ferredoxin:thioredoxin reductase [candidate division KSB1 bacterium]|nr:ferredoxin:thioredoxin reductase [candidate division KSB1 bacterium]
MTVEQYYEALKKFAPTRGLILNPDWEVVRPLLEGLLKNGERYGLRTCPCRPATGDPDKDSDIVCPCVYAKPDIEEYGACYCWLYVSQDWIDGKVPHVQIPERRPVERTLDL